MSLKAFHVVFIAASILLAFGFAAWAFFQYADSRRPTELIYGISSVIIGLMLICYGKYVLRKLRHISYL